MKKFTKNGKTVVFYQKENDKKFSFLIENEPELTQKILASAKTKRVPEKNIFYAQEGIFDKLTNINLLTQKSETMQENPVSLLNEKCQKKWGRNIETTVVSKTGSDHAPIITVEIATPRGLFQAKGSNKKIAARNAANEALKYLF